MKVFSKEFWSLRILLGVAAVGRLAAADFELSADFAPLFQQSGAAVNNVVELADGSLLVAGDFEAIGSTPVSNLARILPDGTVDENFPWQPNFVVHVLALDNAGRILVGGNFNSVNDQPVGRFFRLNADFSWDTAFNNNLGTGFASARHSILVLDDDSIIVGGSGKQLNGQTLGEVVKLLPNGLPDPGFSAVSFSPASTALHLEADANGKFFAVGFFSGVETTEGVVPRNRIARFLADGSLDTSFDPGDGANSTVRRIRPAGNDQWFVMGDFSQYDGMNVRRWVRINADGSRDTTFDTLNTGASSGQVHDLITLPNGIIGISGSFSSFQVSGSSQTIHRVVFLDENLSLASPYPDLEFSLGIARIFPLSDGYAITNATLQFPENVFGLTLVDADLSYVDGYDFFDNATVFAILVEGDSVIVGGDFTHVNGQPRRWVAKLMDDGSLDDSFEVPFTSTGSGSILALANTSMGLLIGGSFAEDTMGRNFRNIARVDPFSGQFDSNFQMTAIGNTPNNRIRDIRVLDDERILIGGWNVGRNPGNSPNDHAIRLLETDGTLITGRGPSSNGPNGEIFALETLPDGGFLVGGSFTDWDGDPNAARLVRLHQNLNRDSGFNNGNPGPSGTVEAIFREPDGKIIIGGFIQNYGGVSRQMLALLNSDGTLDTDVNFGSIPGPVNAILASDDGGFIIGGNFTSVQNQTRPRLARFLPNRFLDSAFLHGETANRFVQALAADGSRLYAGGSFHSFMGHPRLGLVRLQPPEGAPVITVQPEDVIAGSGETVSFSASVEGAEPMSFQWFFGDDPIDGANSPTLTFTATDASVDGFYRLEVSNPAGEDVSRSARLLFEPWPTITVQPEDASASFGFSATLSVTATGEPPLTYQWYEGSSGNTEFPIPGATGSTHTSSYSSTFWVRVSNDFGVVNSDDAQVTIHPAVEPNISGLDDGIVNAGDPFTFTISVTGTSPFTYAWFKDNVLLPDETGPSLSIASTTPAAAGTYRVEVTNSAGQDTSSAVLHVRTVPVFAAQPESQTVPEGATVSFTVEAVGPGPISYQWLRNGSTLGGATGSVLTIENVTSENAGTYTVEATNTYGTTESNPAVLGVNTPPVITLQPVSQAIASGESATLTVSAAGTTPMTYTWYLGTTGDTSQPQGSGSSFDTGSLSATSSFWARASNDFGSDDSETAVITVGQAPVIVSQPVSLVRNEGQSASFSVSAEGSAPLSYQWQRNGVDLPGQAGTSLSFSSVTSANEGAYRVIISNAFGQVQSSNATLTVRVPPTITSHPVSQTVTSGSSVEFSVTATGTAPLNFQWQRNQVDLPGETGPTLIISEVLGGMAGDYRVRVSNAAGTATSNPATLTVNSPPSINGQPSAGVFLAIGSDYTLTVFADGSGTLNYQWYAGESGDTSSPLSGETNSALSLTDVQENASYWVRVSSEFGTVDSTTGFIIVGNPPVITTQPEGVDISVGQTISLSVEATGDGPFSYKWVKDAEEIPDSDFSTLIISDATTADSGTYSVEVDNLFGVVTSDLVEVTVSELTAPFFVSSPNNTVRQPGESLVWGVFLSGTEPIALQWFKDDSAIPGATSDILSFDSVLFGDAGTYFVRATNAAGTVESAPFALTVAEAPTITNHPVDDTAVATGGTRTLSVIATSSLPLTYEWFAGATGDTSTPVGTNASSFTTPPLFSDAQFWVRVSNDAGSRNSATANIEVLDPVQITVPPEPQTVLRQTMATFSVEATGDALSYQWRLNGEIMPDETEPTLEIIPDFGQDGNIVVRVSNRVSTVFSDPVALTVNAAPFILSAPENQLLLTGGDLDLLVTASGSEPLTYQWYFEDDLLVGEDQPSLVREDVFFEDAGLYRLNISNAFGQVDVFVDVEIDGPPSNVVIIGPGTLPYGGSTVLSVNALGSDLEYFWFKGVSGDTGELLSQNSTLSTGTLLDSSFFWLRVTNAFGSVDTPTFVIEVNQPIPVITSPGTASGVAGDLFSYLIRATNGPTSFAADPLPPGLELNPDTGLIFGNPAIAGIYTLSLEASNADFTGSRSLTLDISPPRPVSTGIHNWDSRAGQAVEIPLQIVNNLDSITFIDMPDWLEYDSDARIIFGTPPEDGKFAFQAILGNAGGIAVVNLTLNVVSHPNAPTISSPDFLAGRQESTFSHTLTTTPSATGFSLDGELPDGLALNPISGLIDGIPLEAGSWQFFVTGTNSFGDGPRHEITLVIEPAAGRPAVTTLSEIRAFWTEEIAIPLTAEPLADFFEVDVVPPGLSFDPEENTVAGVPLFTGPFDLRVRGVNAFGAGKWRTIVVDVRPGRETPVVSNDGFARARLTVPYVAQVTATRAPFGFFAEGLPSGLSIDGQTGAITGTPDEMGVFMVAVSAKNIDGVGPVRSMRLFVDEEPGAPVFDPGRTYTTDGVIGGNVNVPFSRPLYFTESPVNFTALSDLPPGLSLDQNGVLGGIPAELGTFTFKVEAESSFGFVSLPTEITVVVGPAPGAPSVTSADAIVAVVGQPFAYSITTNEPFDTINFSSLPGWLSYDPQNQTLSGTPATAGADTVSFQLANAAGAGNPFELQIVRDLDGQTPELQIAPAFELPFAEPFTLQVTATLGPIESYRFQNLPPGLEYDALTGLITGRPIRVGTFTARMSASNENGFAQDLIVRFEVVPEASLNLPRITSSSSIWVNSGMSADFSYLARATNLPDETPLPSGYRFHARGLPSFLELNPSTGIISGKVPSFSEDFTFSIWAETPDGIGPEQSISVNFLKYVFTLNSYITGPSFVSGLVDTPLTFSIRTRGSFSHYSLGSAVGRDYQELFPPGRWFEQTSNRFTLTPRKSGVFFISARALYPGSMVYFTSQVTFQIAPGPNNPVIDSPSEHYAVAGQPIPAYPLQASAPTGFGDISIVIPNGLPPGIYREGDTLRGTIAEPGTYRFGIQAANDLGPGRTKLVSFFVAPAEAAPTIQAFALNMANDEGDDFGQSMSFATFGSFGTLSTMGGDGTFETLSGDAPDNVIEVMADTFFSVSFESSTPALQYRVDDLPEGLLLNPHTGEVAGSVSRPGSYPIEVRARSEDGWGLPSSYILEVAAASGTPVINVPPSLTASVGESFSLLLSATASPTSYDLLDFDGNITLDSESGELTGEFFQPGTAEIRVAANNASGSGYPAVLTVQVSAATGTPVVTAPTHQTGQVGEALSLQLSATGDVDSYGVSGLPFGLQFDSDTGLISGEPLEPGEFTYEAFAVNESGIGVSVPLSFSIEPAAGIPQITGPLAIEIPLGLQSSFTVSSAPQASTYTIGNLPSGLSGNALTGEISGSATTEGTYEVVVRGVNSIGDGSPATLVITVRPATSQEALDAWLDSFAMLTNPEDREPLATPADDGIPNLLKFAFGMNPLEATRDGLPTLDLVASEDEQYLTITIRKNPDAMGLGVVPEVSTSLAPGSWQSGGGLFSVIDEDDETITYRYNTPVDPSTPAFLRVRVEVLP